VLRGLGVSVGGAEESRRAGERDSGGDGNHEIDVDFVLTSCESGYEKPDPLAFEAAVQRARAFLATSRSASAAASSPASTTTTTMAEGEEDASMIQLHIGDDLRTDYEGALAAGTGWNALLLEREGSLDMHLHRGDAGDVCQRPVQRIRQLMDAEPFLLRMCEGF
jgi:hypothetical protein